MSSFLRLLPAYKVEGPEASIHYEESLFQYKLVEILK